jgi:chitin disaccharide deacetylase
MKKYGLLIIGFGIIAGILVSPARPQPTAPGPIRLIVRGDDMGMTHTANMAFERAFRDGILSAGGLIVPSPWFEEAARMCREHPEWPVGVHLCVNGEWQGYRWKPVLPYDQVASLVDEDGFLFPTTESFVAAKPDPAEVDKELRAQVERVRKRKIDIAYIDTHMDTLETSPELKEVVARIGRDYGLPISAECGEDRSGFLDIYNTPPEEKENVLAEKLKKIGPGLWLLVVHPGLDTDEERALIDTHPEGLTEVARRRDAEIRAITSQRIKGIIAERGIKVIGYREFRDKIRSESRPAR